MQVPDPQFVRKAQLDYIDLSYQMEAKEFEEQIQMELEALAKSKVPYRCFLIQHHNFRKETREEKIEQPFLWFFKRTKTEIVDRYFIRSDFLDLLKKLEQKWVVEIEWGDKWDEKLLTLDECLLGLPRIPWEFDDFIGYRPYVKVIIRYPKGVVS